MTRQQLIEQIYTKGTYLCIGLDTDLDKIPESIRREPDAVVRFNKAIIDATSDLCVGYKINTAFYEAMGGKGWKAMEETAAYIPDTHFRIADAKRGDIGNTSYRYAKAFLEELPFDAVTIAPYMGADSVKPFLEVKDKWGIVLGLTSNAGAADFELRRLSDEGAPFLYEEVMRKASEWGSRENMMFVVGATQAEQFKRIREITPEHFYLVPGVGTQGGSLKEISKKAMIQGCGLLVNVSRAVIYASEKDDFAEEAREISRQYQVEMVQYLLPRIGRIGREPI